MTPNEIDRFIPADTVFPTVQTALHNGCQVDVLYSECQHISRLDLPQLVANGRGDVPLIRLPMVCRCGSKRCQVIVSGEAYRNN